MVTLNANIDTTFMMILEEFPYYLFVFRSSECDSVFEVFTASEESCGDQKFITANVTIPMGVYSVDIYGQSDYDNIDTDFAEYIKTEFIKVYNPDNICWMDDELTDEFNYPLQDENLKTLKR